MRVIARTFAKIQRSSRFKTQDVGHDVPGSSAERIKFGIDRWEVCKEACYAIAFIPGTSAIASNVGARALGEG